MTKLSYIYYALLTAGGKVIGQTEIEPNHYTLTLSVPDLALQDLGYYNAHQFHTVLLSPEEEFCQT